MWALALRAMGGLWLAKQRIKARQGTVVLALHRVLDEEQASRTNSLSGMFLRRRTFEALAAYANRNLMTVDVVGGGEMGSRRRPCCALTFDDGWEDNYSVAWPIAQAHGIPITIFVCPGLIGQDAPFWPERMAGEVRAAYTGISEPQLQRLIEWLKTRPSVREDAIKNLPAASVSGGPDKTLGWNQIFEMDLDGVTIGAHTQTHVLLTTVPRETARTEIAQCRDDLEQALKKPCQVFAYPNGNYSEDVRNLLVSEGFERAFTTRPGIWTADSDPLAIPRKCISESDVVTPGGRFSPALFEHAAFWRTWREGRGC
jgi:peptidoglycan/xylan/chitin deacetylase (PgdA/CDA1 family)